MSTASRTITPPIRVATPSAAEIRLKSFSSETVGLRSSGTVSEKVALGHTDGVDDHEAVRFFTVPELRRRELQRLPYDLYSAEFAVGGPAP